MKKKREMDRWFVVIGTGMLGLACMLLAGATIYDKFAATDPVPAWALPVSIAGGILAGGLFTYALQKLIYQWIGLDRSGKQ